MSIDYPEFCTSKIIICCIKIKIFLMYMLFLAYKSIKLLMKKIKNRIENFIMPQN